MTSKQKQKPGKKEDYVIHIGPLMLRVLEDQKNSVKEVTYDAVNPSFYEVAEIVAKKILGLI